MQKFVTLDNQGVLTERVRMMFNRDGFWIALSVGLMAAGSQVESAALSVFLLLFGMGLGSFTMVGFIIALRYQHQWHDADLKRYKLTYGIPLDGPLPGAAPAQTESPDPQLSIDANRPPLAFLMTVVGAALELKNPLPRAVPTCRAVMDEMNRVLGESGDSMRVSLGQVNGWFGDMVQRGILVGREPRSEGGRIAENHNMLSILARYGYHR